MSGLPRFISENPADPKNQVWLKDQIKKLERDNSEIAENIVGLRNTLEANASQIRGLRAFLHVAQ
jgi:hypothetical protein